MASDHSFDALRFVVPDKSFKIGVDVAQSPLDRTLTMHTRELRYTKDCDKTVNEIYKRATEMEMDNHRRPDVLILGIEAYENLMMYIAHRNPHSGATYERPRNFEGMDIVILPHPHFSKLVAPTYGNPVKSMEVAWREDVKFKKRVEKKSAKERSDR
jgi:hypothetical protein